LFLEEIKEAENISGASMPIAFGDRMKDGQNLRKM
jgi:hypothetical protein